MIWFVAFTARLELQKWICDEFGIEVENFGSFCPCHAGCLNLRFRLFASEILGVVMTDQVTWALTDVVEARKQVLFSELPSLQDCAYSIWLFRIFIFLDLWEILIWRQSSLLKVCRRRLCMKVGWCVMAGGRSAGPSFTCGTSCLNLGCLRIIRRSLRIIR